MKPPVSPSVAILLIAAATLFPALAGEVLLHEGPQVAVGISSLASPEQDGADMTFIKQFKIDDARLAKLPPPHVPPAEPAVSASRAAGIATQSVFLGDNGKKISVVKNELLTATVGDSKTIEYHFIEILANGSTEHRIVLMDGSVLKPRLKKMEDRKPDTK